MRHLLDIPDLPLAAFKPRPDGGMTLHGKSKAPPPPDYAAAARETASGNLEAAKYSTVANRANQYTPYGSLTWQRGATDFDPWTQQISLTSQGQSLLDQGNKTSQNLANLQDEASARVKAQQNRGWNDGAIQGPARALNADGRPMGGAVYNPYSDTNNATQAIMARLNPQLDRRRASSETQLANQGIQRGSEAWKNAQTDLTEAENDAYSQASLQGIGLGMQQQGQTFGQTMQGVQQGLQAQNQGFSQANALRNQGFQEQAYMANRDLNALNALRTGAQVTNPTFGAYAQQQTTAGPDMLGATTQGYNAALGGVNAANANSANLASGAMSALGTAAAGAAFF